MGNTNGTPNSGRVSTKLNRIAELAAKMSGVPLRTLAHPIDMDLMREAYEGTRKDGVPGVDGETAAGYERELEGT
jgi:RNA-directed DNA polymerase